MFVGANARASAFGVEGRPARILRTMSLFVIMPLSLVKSEW